MDKLWLLAIHHPPLLPIAELRNDMLMRFAVFFSVLFLSSQLFAGTFPTGTFKGTGFKVEKGNMKITDKEMYYYNSSMTVTKRNPDSYAMTIAINLQPSPSTPKKTDQRTDVFNVIWDTPTSGKLLNKDSAYANDKTTFVINKNELIVRSWVSRNELWETHTYSLPK